MDLMSLLAKLTLDKTEYDEGLEEAEKSAKDLSLATPKLPKVDNTDFKAGLDEAEETGSVFQQVMTGVWQGLKDSIVSIGVIGMVTSLVSSLREGISLAAKNGDAISKGAKNLQLSTKAYQEYEYVLGKSNLQVKDLQGAMTKFDTIRGGKITEQQAQYFEELGINAEEASSGMMSAEQMLTSVMNSLADYKGADKGAIIDAFFGKSDKWTGYFDQTSEKIKELKEEASDLGLIMSDESIQNAADFADASEKLADRLEAIKRSFGEGILPLITDAVNKLMMVMNYFIGTDNRSTSDMLKDTDSKMTARMKEIESNTARAEALLGSLLGMGDTSKMDANQLIVWKGTAAALLDLIPTLSGYIDKENASLNGTSEELDNVIKKYEELDKETAYQTARAEKENILTQKQNKINEESIKINEKLADAEGKKAAAYAAIDEFLKNPRNEGYRRNLESNAGYTGTMTDEIYNRYSGMFNAWMGDNSKLKEYRDALAEVTEAQANVEAFSADLAEGIETFNDWKSTLGETYGEVSGTAQAAQGDVAAVTDALNDIPGDVYSTIHITTDGDGYPHAKGAWNIPMDNYPALLHRGEMVLSASQARRYRDGESGGTDNALIVELIGEVRELRRRNIYMDGDKVADLTTERTKNNMNAQNRSKTRAYGGT